MNPLSAFNFSGLIKTFLPGWTIFLGFFILFAIFFPNYLGFVSSQKEVFILTAIIGSVILGLTCNTVVFCFVLKPAIRQWHERQPENAEFYNKKNAFEGEFRKKYAGSDGVVSSLTLDCESLAIDKDSLPLLIYWMERYWFYMEFQINMVISGFFLGICHFIYYIRRFSCCEGVLNINFVMHMLLSLGFMAFVWLMLYAARINYGRHLVKMQSLAVAHYARLLTTEKAKSSEKKWFWPLRR